MYCILTISICTHQDSNVWLVESLLKALRAKYHPSIQDISTSTATTNDNNNGDF